MFPCAHAYQQSILTGFCLQFEHFNMTPGTLSLLPMREQPTCCQELGHRHLNRAEQVAEPPHERQLCCKSQQLVKTPHISAIHTPCVHPVMSNATKHYSAASPKPLWVGEYMGDPNWTAGPNSELVQDQQEGSSHIPWL